MMGIRISLDTGEITNDGSEHAPPSAEDMRAIRNGLLARSDWTQGADAPVNQAAWAVYRQALRAVPEQSGFPESIVWPTPPA